MELGSEDDPAGTAHATHPVRKRIAIKLRHGGKGRGAGGALGRKAKMKSAKDLASERGQAEHDDDDTHFGEKLQLICYCLISNIMLRSVHSYVK